MLTATDPLGHVTSATYDQCGQRTVVTGATNRPTTFGYHAGCGRHPAPGPGTLGTAGGTGSGESGDRHAGRRTRDAREAQ